VLAVSWAAAVLACLGYGVATILESVGAKRVTAVAGLTGLALIARQMPYLLGCALDLVAFGANVLALRQLPLFLVQSIVAASVGVTAVIAHVRGARLTGRDWVSLAVLGIGLVLLSVSAVPGGADRISLVADVVILGCAIVPLVVGLIGLRLTGRAAAVVLSVAAGLGFTGVAVAARGIELPDGLVWSLLLQPLVAAVVVHGAIAMVFFTLALQRGNVTTVTAITFVIEVVAPSLIGIGLFGDTVEPQFRVLAGAGFVLAIAGTVWLSRLGAEQPRPAARGLPR
jgi:drug/metabolite transporter (DMT)-like permease